MFINEYLLNERESRILVDECILVDFETEVRSEKISINLTVNIQFIFL